MQARTLHMLVLLSHMLIISRGHRPEASVKVRAAGTMVIKRERCESQEQGTCLNINADTCESGVFVAGLCSGPANILCCIPMTTDKERTCSAEGHSCWLSSRADKCGGTLTRGKCPGSAQVRCCEAQVEPWCEVQLFTSTECGGSVWKAQRVTNHFEWSLSQAEANLPKSAKMNGNCEKVQYLDNDFAASDDDEFSISKPDDGQCYSFPWDISEDLIGVNIWVHGEEIVADDRDSSSEENVSPSEPEENASPGQQTAILEATTAESSKYSYRSTAAAGKVMKASALGRSVLFDLRTLGSTNRLCKRTDGGSCVNRYMDLTNQYVISTAALQRVGYTSSGMKIFRSVVMGESGGKGGAINNWDNQYVSWGLFQAAGKAGTLARMLCHLKALQLSSGIFNQLLVPNGIDVADCPGWRSKLQITSSAGAIVSGNAEGSRAMQFNMAQLGTLMIGGQFEELVAGQSDYWRLNFLKAGINKKVQVDGGTRLCELVTSEWGLAVVARLYNWMPGWVAKWTNEFIDANPSFRTRAAWQQNEHAFIDYWNVKRKAAGRKQYVHGTYPVYPGEVLSDSSGSFDAACM